jgi:hypothetical protein
MLPRQAGEPWSPLNAWATVEELADLAAEGLTEAQIVRGRVQYFGLGDKRPRRGFDKNEPPVFTADEIKGKRRDA